MVNETSGLYLSITRDTSRLGNNREPRYADLEPNHGNAHEGHSYITRKLKVEASTYDGKLDANTFSDC